MICACAAKIRAASEAETNLIYSCPQRELPGLVKVAVHSGTVTTAEQRNFTPDVATTVTPVMRWLRERAPFLDPNPVMAETCLYTNTPDEDFILDRVPGRPHIVVCSPCSGHGFKFAPWIGWVAAGLAVGGPKAKPRGDVSLFTVTRPALEFKWTREAEIADAPAMHAKL